jgi:hypothetical protein
MARFYRAAAEQEGFRLQYAMGINLWKPYDSGTAGRFLRQLLIAAALLCLGAGVLPALIFYAGSTLLGRYEEASLGNTFHTVITGLATPSIASWIVVLGPYLLFQLYRALGSWWRTSS